MRAVELITAVESVVGKYKQIPFTTKFNTFIGSINRAIASIIPDAQPKELLQTCYFIRKDGISDFLVWKSFSSEEENSLNRALKNMPPERTAYLPTYENEELSYRIASIQSSSSRRLMQNNIPYPNKYLITYDQEEFISLCDNNVRQIISRDFIDRITLSIPTSHSRYIRAIIYDIRSKQSEIPKCDILFRSFSISQDVSEYGYSLIYNSRDKTIKISASKMSFYRVIVYSSCFKKDVTALLIKGNRLYANGDVKSMAINEHLAIQAYILPPIILTENQLLAKELCDNGILFDLIVYAAADNVTRLLGFPQEDISISYKKSLDRYVESSFCDLSGDYTRQEVSMD